ncbi:MAG: ABC transporter ATP-binding protein [Mesorhizobium sp.]
MTAPAVRIEDLGVSYASKTVIRGLTLPTLPAGTVTALVGPNAAGKSTLLRAVAGLVPAAGKILLDGDDLFSMSRVARARRVGFMPQLLPAAAGLSVLETVLVALKVTSPPMPEKLLRQRAMSVLARLDAIDIALEPLGRLSGGQRQIAALAQALVPDPSLLLLDEPTSALDLRHQFRIMRIVRELTRDGHTAIIVLHDLALAAEWADMVVVMQRGALYAAGSPRQAITNKMLRDVYGVVADVSASSNGSMQIEIRDVASADNFENMPRVKP